MRARYEGQTDRGGLDVPPRVPCPGGCGRNVQMRIETDGMGDLIESVEPCRRCRPSRYRAPDGHRIDLCRHCGERFSQPIRRGRPRVSCPRCADG